MPEPTPILPWFPWPGRGWPASIAQEQIFVDDLRSAATEPHTGFISRTFYTAVLNALRGGASYGDVRSLAPGLPPAGLLVAYEDLKQRLTVSRTSWDAIFESIDAEKDVLLGVVASNLDPISPVLPTPAERILPAVVSGNPETLHAILSYTDRNVTAALSAAHALEHELAELGELPYRDAIGVQIGQLLYDPYADSAYTHPFYLPDRIASVDAPRARMLLADILFEDD